MSVDLGRLLTAGRTGFDGRVRGTCVDLRPVLSQIPCDLRRVWFTDVGLIEPGFTGADFQYPEFPPEKQRELIEENKMLRAEDIAVAVHFMLRQPRRCAVSLMRVETRLNHP